SGIEPRQPDRAIGVVGGIGVVAPGIKQSVYVAVAIACVHRSQDLPVEYLCRFPTVDGACAEASPVRSVGRGTIRRLKQASMSATAAVGGRKITHEPSAPVRRVEGMPFPEACTVAVPSWFAELHATTGPGGPIWRVVHLDLMIAVVVPPDL